MRQRIHFLKKAVARRIPKWLLGIFFFVSVWDTIVAQFLPPAWEEKAPDVYWVLSTMSGFLPFWAWALIGLLLLLIISVEYGVRRQHAIGAVRMASEAVASGSPDIQLLPIREVLPLITKSKGWETKEHAGLLPAAHVLRQAAQRGCVTIEGRQRINEGSPFAHEFSKIWTEIPAEYWTDHTFDLTRVLDDSPSHHVETEAEDSDRPEFRTTPRYAALRARADEIESVWPIDSREGDVAKREFITLREAATRAYEETEGTLVGKAASMPLSDGESMTLTWYATAIAGGRDSIPLFGKNPPSRVRREIPLDVIKQHRFSDDARSLVRNSDKKVQFIDLEVRETDFLHRLEIIKCWGAEP